MQSATTSQGAVSGDVRNLLMAENLVVLALSLVVYGHFSSHWWWFVGLLFVPDISLLGYLISPRVGALTYNSAHSYVLPLVLLIFAYMTNQMEISIFVWIWTAHIGLDRMLGYGLKYRTAFGSTHLGMIGKK